MQESGFDPRARSFLGGPQADIRSLVPTPSTQLQPSYCLSTLAPDFDSYTKDSFDAKSKETLSNYVIDGDGRGSGDIC